MKKLIFVLILIAVISPVFAQDHNYDSKSHPNMYYFNVPVEKIFMSLHGYIIMYRKNSNELGAIGIPYEWFSDSAGRAEIIRLPRGTNWPTMSVFYRDGDFSYVRLYVHHLKTHRTWGVINPATDVSSYFSDRENFNIQY